MDYADLSKDREYKITVKPNGDIALSGMQGETVNIDTATWIVKRLNEEIVVKKYLYVIIGMGRKRDEWKIGVSSDPYRRAKELKGLVWNSIPLESRLCWRLEKYVHEKLSQYHIGNEWYRFEDDAGHELITMLTNDVKTHSQLLSFIFDLKLTNSQSN